MKTTLLKIFAWPSLALTTINNALESTVTPQMQTGNGLAFDATFERTNTTNAQPGVRNEELVAAITGQTNGLTSLRDGSMIDKSNAYGATGSDGVTSKTTGAMHAAGDGVTGDVSTCLRE